MAYKMVVSDIDGTLVSWSGSLSAGIRESVDRLTAAGIRFTLATGRRRRVALPVARELGLSGPIVTFDGAAIIDGDSGECLSVHEIPPDRVIAAIDVLESQPGLITIVQASPRVSDAVYVGSDSHKQHVETVWPSMVPDLTVSELREVATIGICRILALGETALLTTMVRRLSSWPGRVAIWPSVPTPILECYAPGIDKGRGLSDLCRRLGMDEHEVVAVGDDFNDLPLLRRAGLAVVVANARPEVLAVADLVCDDVEQCGMTEVLDRIADGTLKPDA